MSFSVELFKVVGNACMKKQDFTGAIESYKRGLKREPKNPILNCNLAQAFLSLNNFVEAEKFAKVAIELKDDYVKGYYRAAKAALGRYKVYESMLYLVQGVHHCAHQDLKELFVMARDLSQEFEIALRIYKDEVSSKLAQPGQHGQKKNVDEQLSPEKGKSGKVTKSLVGGKVSEEAQSGKESGNANSPKETVNSKSAQNTVAHDKAKCTKETEKAVSAIETGKAKTANKTGNAKSEGHEVLEKAKKECEDLFLPPELMQEEWKIFDAMKKECDEYNNLESAKEIEKAASSSETVKAKCGDAKCGGLESHEKEAKEELKALKEAKEAAYFLQHSREQVTEEQINKSLKPLSTMQEKLAEKIMQDNAKIIQDYANSEKPQKLLKKQELKEKKRQEKLNLNLHAEKEQKIKKDKLKELNYIMMEGSLALIKGLNRKAVDNFKKIYLLPSPEVFLDYMEIVIVQYAFSQALILSDEYTDIVKAIDILENLEKEGRHSKFPAIFLLLGKAYVRLNRFKNAQSPLERGLSFLSRGTSFSRYSWPGTCDVIEFTDRKILYDALQQELCISKLYHKPDAVCFYEKCLSTCPHFIPSRNIFFSDPDFVGFIDILCQENCHINFHLSCWKDFKEHRSEIEKLSEKDFLGQKCFTPDCTKKKLVWERAVIIKVTTIGPDGEEKSSCGCTAPLPSTSDLHKEKSSILKSPKKKQKKKTLVQNGRAHVKRTRTHSRSIEDSQSGSDPPRKVQECQLEDAISKLSMARKNNFGYEGDVPDPFQVHTNVIKMPALGKNEEFVYSYFHEIFKEEGFMSIFKLQEHWESNKELLPTLEPILITHTDLLKFLLDTGRFAVVQDMIGISSELANISAIVESKSEDPLPMKLGWQPSPATLHEARQTLSFTSVSNDLETGCEEADFNDGHVTQYVYGDAGYINISEQSGSSSYSNHFTNEVLRNEFSKSSLFLEPDKVTHTNNFVNNDDDNHNRHQHEVEPSYITTNLPEKFISFQPRKKGVGCELSPKLQNSDTNENSYCGNFITSQMNSIISVEETVLTSANVQSLEPSKSDVSIIKETPCLKTARSNGHLQTGLRDFDQALPVKQTSVQPVVQKPERVAWKPRAKLLEWACETFPGESKEKLWEALTQVRAHNNYTLSGLSFDIIGDRVKSVLLSECKK